MQKNLTNQLTKNKCPPLSHTKHIWIKIFLPQILSERDAQDAWAIYPEVSKPLIHCWDPSAPVLVSRIRSTDNVETTRIPTELMLSRWALLGRCNFSWLQFPCVENGDAWSVTEETLKFSFLLSILVTKLLYYKKVCTRTADGIIVKL